MFSHLTWVHYLGSVIILFLFSLLSEGFRTLLSDLLVKRVVNAWKAFWGIEQVRKAPSGGAPDPEFVTIETFKEHKDGDNAVLSAIKQGMDQTAFIVQNSVKHMNEQANLITISQKGMRQELDEKIGKVHERVDAFTGKVSTLSGQLDVLIPLVQNQLNNGKSKGEPHGV